MEKDQWHMWQCRVYTLISLHIRSVWPDYAALCENHQPIGIYCQYRLGSACISAQSDPTMRPSAKTNQCYVIFYLVWIIDIYTLTNLPYAHHPPLSISALFTSISFFLFLPPCSLSTLFYVSVSCIINYKAKVSWYFLHMLNIHRDSCKSVFIGEDLQ